MREATIARKTTETDIRLSLALEGEAYRKMMNTITGTAVFAAVMVTVIVMLIRSSKSKKEVERDEKI